MHAGEETVRSEDDLAERGWLLRAVGVAPSARRVVEPGDKVRVGRAPTLPLVLPHESVSRVHCEVAASEEGLWVTDLGSRNGTYLEGRRLLPKVPAKVRPGAAIRVGEVVILTAAPTSSLPSTSDTRGEAMRRALALLDRVAPDDIPVLLLGETGVGKEVLATRLHRGSHRASGPFVQIHCAALAESLIEAELFGHERGAFTGATAPKPGLFQVAGGGTVLIDEVGEIPPSFQVKLLRVLEERKVTRVGGRLPEPIDVRFVAATHRDLRAEVAAGRFREDLYYRLSGVTVTIPPLRDRLEELPGLVRALLESICRERRAPLPTVSAGAQRRLAEHAWPGNIRELRNVLARASLLADGAAIEEVDLAIDAHVTRPATVAADVRTASGEPDPAAVERARIVDALDATGGNQKEAAKLLGIARRTLLNKLDAYELSRPRKRAPRPPE